MHPRVFLDQLWRNDLRNEVFVAMPFRDEMHERWTQIVVPAIESERLNGIALRAKRVDISRSGDSILTEIMDGVAHASMILADISVTDRWIAGGEARVARNGNVMYEVGLALASRQPVEVALFRDDEEPILFDLSTIPVLRIEPTNVAASVGAIRALLADRLRERDLLKDFRLVRTRDTLSQFELNMILQNRHLTLLGWKGGSLPAAVAIALPALLQKQVLRLARVGRGDQPHVYEWTTFGRALADSLPAYDAPTGQPGVADGER